MFSKLSIRALRSAKRPCQALPGPLSPAVKRPGRESDHPPQSVADLGMRVAPAQPSTAENWPHHPPPATGNTHSYN